jgi:hypothetical protein
LLLLGHLHLQHGDPAYRQSEEFHPRSKVFRHNAARKAWKGVLPRQMWLSQR